MKHTYIGIDPGAPMWAAMVSDSGRLLRLSKAEDMGKHRERTKGKGYFFNDAVKVEKLLSQWGDQAKNPVVVGLEQVGSREGEDRIASDVFVGSMWMARGIAAAHRWQVISTAPIVWKTYFGLKFKPGDESKDKKQRSLDLAKELWPSWAIYFRNLQDHNKAEAALIAEWTRRTIQDGTSRT